MIDFDIRKCNSLAGGLNFQLAYRYDNNSEIDLTDIDFSQSIICSEYAFAIIEDFFSSKYDFEEKKFYHWESHIHSLNDLFLIVKKLSAFELHLKDKIQTRFIWEKSELISRENNIEDIRNGTIKLAWSTEEMRNELMNNILEKSYRKKILSFIEKVKIFIEESFEKTEINGIYVIGV